MKIHFPPPINSTYEMTRLYWEPTNLMQLEGADDLNLFKEWNSERNPFGIKLPILQIQTSLDTRPQKNSYWLYFEGPPVDATFSHSSFAVLLYCDEDILTLDSLSNKLKPSDLLQITPIDMNL